MSKSLKEWINPSSTKYGLLTILLIIFIGFATIYIPMWCNKTENKNLSTPLVFEGEPQGTIRYNFKYLKHPDTVKMVHRPKKIDPLVKDTSLRNPIFLNLDSVTTQPLRLVEQTINIDSLKKQPYVITDKTVAQFMFTFKLVNKSDKLIHLVFMAVADTVSLDPVLRKLVFAHRTQQDMEKRTLDDFELNILIDSSRDYSMILPSVSSTGKSIIHFLVVYRDADFNYYDAYYWAKYDTFDPQFYIYPVQLYNYQSDSILTSSTTFVCDPRPPKFHDYFKFKDSKQDDRHLSVEETEEVKRYFHEYK